MGWLAATGYRGQVSNKTHGWTDWSDYILERRWRKEVGRKLSAFSRM